MKNTEIAERVAGKAGITKETAQAAVGAVFDTIGEALARSEDDSIVGFGRFSKTGRPTREGRNPRTGSRIAIGPSAGLSLKAGKPLKDALNCKCSVLKLNLLKRFSRLAACDRWCRSVDGQSR